MKITTIALLLLATLACDEGTVRHSQKNLVLHKSEINAKSSNVGNLAATAIQRIHNLDVVLYPAPLIDSSHMAKLDDPESVLGFFTEGPKDQMMIGRMSGRSLKEFVRDRSLERYMLELETAGLTYHIMYRGGFPILENFGMENGRILRDDEQYRVAISQFYFFSGETFPSYKYRNSITTFFSMTTETVSVRDSVREYLASGHSIPDLRRPRATVEMSPSKKVGRKSIAQIQGKSHISPLLGSTVTTRGIVTALASYDWYPGGTEFFLQDKTLSKDPRISSGIHVFTEKDILDIKVGDELEITAEVFEEMTGTGLTRTQLRQIKSYKVLSSGNSLPEAIKLGREGRSIPHDRISTYRGDLNFKPALNLADGIDFWESLESMRVSFKDLRITGFRGGKESSDPFELKSYLSLYAQPDGLNLRSQVLTTRGGGVLAVPENDAYNPQMINLSSGNLTKGLTSEHVFNMGDVIEGEVEGILTYNKNLFGDGDYQFMIPDENSLPASINRYAGRAITPLESRPQFGPTQADHQLTIAAYNLKNLSANDDNRILDTGKMISQNLKCPDIVGLVEVQDNNGLSIDGESNADLTLKKINDAIQCPGKNYGTINIDPQAHREGGQPGGNIRVAILYDQNRVSFSPRQLPDVLTETLIMPDGNLNYNPGRIYPNSEEFKSTRKSLIAQFEFRGEPVFVIVNHLNSKLGDSSHWGNMQPSIPGSDDRRIRMAMKLNLFAKLIEKYNSRANIAIIGDFNAHIEENAMRVLCGDVLVNMMKQLDPNDRYSTNHNGNSQSLDYILANRNLVNRNGHFESIHLNSDFMGRLSDHDPVMGIFDF